MPFIFLHPAPHFAQVLQKQLQLSWSPKAITCYLQLPKSPACLLLYVPSSNVNPK
jgi:hypothetical protein